MTMIITVMNKTMKMLVIRRNSLQKKKTRIAMETSSSRPVHSCSLAMATTLLVRLQTTMAVKFALLRCLESHSPWIKATMMAMSSKSHHIAIITTSRRITSTKRLHAGVGQMLSQMKMMKMRMKMKMKKLKSILRRPKYTRKLENTRFPDQER